MVDDPETVFEINYIRNTNSNLSVYLPNSKIDVHFPDNNFYIVYPKLHPNTYLFNSKHQYIGKSIDILLNQNTFEISQTSYVDVNHALDFKTSNVTINSPLFYSRQNNVNKFYIMKENNIFVTDLSLNEVNLLISSESLLIQRYDSGETPSNTFLGQNINILDLSYKITNNTFTPNQHVLDNSFYSNLFQQNLVTYRTLGSQNLTSVSNMTRLNDFVNENIFIYDASNNNNVLINNNGNNIVITDLSKNNTTRLITSAYSSDFYIGFRNNATRAIVSRINPNNTLSNIYTGNINPIQLAIIPIDVDYYGNATTPNGDPKRYVWVATLLNTNELTLNNITILNGFTYSKSVDTSVTNTNILLGRGVVPNIGFSQFAPQFITSPILVYVKNNSIWVTVMGVNDGGGDYISNYTHLNNGFSQTLLEMMSSATTNTNFILRIENQNQIFIDRINIRATATTRLLTNITSISSPVYTSMIYSDTDNLIKVLIYHSNSVLRFMELDINLNIVTNQIFFDNLSNVNQVLIYEQNQNTYIRYSQLNSSQIISYQVNIPNMYNTSFDNKIYTLIDKNKYFTRDNIDSTTYDINTKNLPIQTLTNQNEILLDYEKSIYYLENNITKKLDFSNNVVQVDLSAATYINYPIDSDEKIRVSIDKTKKMFFNDFFYNEVLYGEETLRLDDFYSYTRDDGYSSLSLDGNQMMYFDRKTKIIYMLSRNLNNSFEVKYTMIPDPEILNIISSNENLSSIKVDWKNKYIYIGLASLDSNGKGKVLVCSWETNSTNYILEEVLSSIFNKDSKSFGLSIDITPFGDIVAIGEPLAKPVRNYKQGIVHIY